MTSRQIYERAVANDDAWPDWICPGCEQDITGWREFEFHFAPPDPTETGRRDRRRFTHMPSHRVGTPWPFANATGSGAQPCPWDQDMLSARAIRRRLIQEGVTTDR